MGLPRFTNLDAYYADPAQWGGHQYTTFDVLVNNFMYSLDNDAYIANTARGRVVYHGKRSIQELYFDVANEIIAIELELSPSLNITLPHDFVNYVRISWVDDCGKLHPLAMDNSYNLAQAYLQDNEYNFLFDNQGDILQGTHIQDRVGCNPPNLLQGNRGDFSVDGIESYVAPYFYQSGPYNTDRSKLFKNGSYRIDKERGVIQFSSDVDGKIIVLEYLSDGLFQRADNEIKIHKFAEEATYAYIYWMLIRMRRNVPRGEKESARRDYWNFRRIAKRRIQPLRYEEVRQVLKSQTKNIKD